MPKSKQAAPKAFSLPQEVPLERLLPSVCRRIFGASPGNHFPSNSTLPRPAQPHFFCLSRESVYNCRHPPLHHLLPRKKQGKRKQTPTRRRCGVAFPNETFCLVECSPVMCAEFRANKPTSFKEAATNEQRFTWNEVESTTCATEYKTEKTSCPRCGGSCANQRVEVLAATQRQQPGSAAVAR